MVSPGNKLNSSNSRSRLKKDDNNKIFNVSLKQTIPRPQDISDADKVYLLPKLEGQNAKL